MPWVSRVGRPPDLVHDATPLRAGQVDVGARVAWLLRVSRLASPYGRTDGFLKTLSGHGYPLTASSLSKRERNLDPIDERLIVAYELALGQPPGQLRGVTGLLRRTLGGQPPARRLGAALSRAEISRHLGRLDEHILAGVATSEDWLLVAALLTESGGVVLPPRMTQEWAYTLFSEMRRAVNDAYVGRYEALSRLSTDPFLQPMVAEIAFDVAQERGAHGVNDVLALVGEMRSSTVFNRLHALLRQPAERLRQSAAQGLVEMVFTGNLAPGQAGQLHKTVVDMARNGTADDGLAAFRIAQRMSVEATRQVIDALGSDPFAAAVGMHLQAPALLDRYVVDAAAVSGLDNDRMLERLLREALSVDFIERRHLAALTISASPYAEVVGDTALEIFLGATSLTAREAAGHLLTYLVRAEHRNAVVKVLDDQEAGIRRLALMALAHGGGVPEDVDLHQHLIDPQVGRMATYAAGMSEHPDLASVRDLRFADQEVRDGADWFLQHGGAVQRPR